MIVKVGNVVVAADKRGIAYLNGEPMPDEQEKQNFNIAVPQYLTTDDGRKLMIRRWAPVVSKDSPTTVSIEAFILGEE